MADWVGPSSGHRLHFSKGAELMDAAIGADVETVTKLLEEGVEPNWRDGDGSTPLHR